MKRFGFGAFIALVAYVTVAWGESREITGPGGLVFGVSFSPDGKTFASGSFDDLVRIWEWPSGKELQVLKGHTSRVYSVVYNKDGSILASGSDDKTIRTWDPKDGK